MIASEPDLVVSATEGTDGSYSWDQPDMAGKTDRHFAHPLEHLMDVDRWRRSVGGR
jgi:hypothetical protein